MFSLTYLSLLFLFSTQETVNPQLLILADSFSRNALNVDNGSTVPREIMPAKVLLPRCRYIQCRTTPNSRHFMTYIYMIFVPSVNSTAQPENLSSTAPDALLNEFIFLSPLDLSHLSKTVPSILLNTPHKSPQKAKLLSGTVILVRRKYIHTFLYI